MSRLDWRGGSRSKGACARLALLAKDRKQRYFVVGNTFDRQAGLYPSAQAALDDCDPNPVLFELPSHSHARGLANAGAVHKHYLSNGNCLIRLMKSVGVQASGSGDAHRLAVEIAVAANIVYMRPGGHCLRRVGDD